MGIFMGLLTSAFVAVVNMVEVVFKNPNVSYGLSIIVMTLIIRLALAPLTVWQTKSMAIMQALAPETKKIQAKYKGDQQKMMSEISRLNKANHTSQMAGCLPMLIQLPLISLVFALFRNLTVNNIVGLVAGAVGHPGLVVTTEAAKTFCINGVSFLWIPDLSQKDPYYIIPILVFVTTILQTLASQSKKSRAAAQAAPGGMDPIKMSVVMALFMAFLTSGYTATLGIYWVSGNIIQTIIMVVLRKLGLMSPHVDEIIIPDPIKDAYITPAKNVKTEKTTSDGKVIKTTSNPYIKVKSSKK